MAWDEVCKEQMKSYKTHMRFFSGIFYLAKKKWNEEATIYYAS